MPANHRSLFPREDERRVLEELERLHREIQKARRERDRAGAEFDEFVRSFREPPPAGSPNTPPPFSRTEERAPGIVRGPAVPAQAPAVPPAAVPPASADVPAVPPAAMAYGSASVATTGAGARRSRARIAVIAVAVIAAGFAATRLWRSAPPPTPANVQRPAPVPSERGSATAPAEVTGRSSSAPQQAPLEGELIAARAVWVRVTQDGRRTAERELRAGERVPLRASDSIVIRAGDAGAVHVRLGDGREAPLGPTGEVLTRTFRAAPRQ